ncbi:class I SAM-dependent methyltransferase [Listeria ilorinensis]|uniref:class I SAM-dependent methyltransferase n=1 Tax=Listeria ilorinensis TaxID=2867439 RepID=UPI001EF4F09F|nr:class I SAM-dependent methyltransferase [Listeria ilorinensis]
MANSGTPEKLFQVLDDTAIILQNALEMSYLEAVYETSENLFQQEVLQTEELSEKEAAKLAEHYREIDLKEYAPEEIRKSFQLALLKGMKHGIQTNHQMTPDSIGFIIAYLVEKVMRKEKKIALLDPACGTANLLSTIVNQLKMDGKKEVHATGVEVDDLLISLALVGSDLQGLETTFLHQDGLANLLVDPVDVVASDLPVGYYPDDVRAADFEAAHEEGHSFAHFLLIEQGLRYTKPGGYLFFLVPDRMFETADFAKLDRVIKKYGHTLGILKLPDTLFKTEQARKNILILQRKGADIKAPKEVLLANIPSLTNPHELAPILKQIDSWFEDNTHEGN